MRSEPAKPIFIVGSPRSGTSILAWCLGQHPNIFPVPESNWMGEFARNIAAAHRIGSARGELSILSAMEIDADELFATIGQSIDELILRHRTDLQTKREKKAYESKIDPGWLDATSTTTGPKSRWVDGTPEYAFHICGLRKLFPGALFIHLVREVDSVVRSMLNFHRVAGDNLVASEEQAYNYWLRAVSACLEAEKAYGPRIVYRLLYSDLTTDPESTIRRLLDFVGEPYDAKCLKPLAVRINSSNVPADFKSEDPVTNRATIEKSRHLFTAIQRNMQPGQASRVASDRLDAALWEPWLQAERSQQELKDQIWKLQQHHIGEVDEYKSQIRELQQHHVNEIDHYKSQIASQKAQYRDAAERYKSEIRIAQKEHTATTRKLMRLLSKVEKAAARLRDSRRWKLVNFGGVMKAKLSHREGMPGYGDLDEVVAAYSEWRASAKKAGARKSVDIDSSGNAERTSDA